MIADASRIYDGFSGLAGGQDSGRRPSLIGKDQCERAENMVFRGGAPTTRPAFRQLAHIFLNSVRYNTKGGVATSGGVETQFAFLNKTFQAISYYSVPQTECFMALVGGRLFQLVPKETTFEIKEIELPPLRNRETLPIAYMVQADQNHITQDGESLPIIFDGVTARRPEEDEIFTGSIMAYGLGRIVLVVKDKIYFGDLYDSHGNAGDDCLKFTETRFLNEGFPSALPSKMGKPTGAAFFAQQDTSTGTGELMVFGENGAESFFLSLQRERWKDSPFQRAALLDTGAQGHRAIISVNEDLWFRSTDGWRSYRQARAQVNYWSQIPLSTAVRPFTDADTPSILSFGSAIHFDNRLIATCTPQWNQGRVFHRGLLSLDFDVLSAFGRSGQPAWDGHWARDNIKISQIVNGTFNGKDRAFIFGIDENDRNAFWEITRNGVNDFARPNEEELIPWELRARSMDFESEFNLKELYGMDVWMDDAREPITADISYRADQKPDYIPWGTLTGTDAVGTASAITPGGLPTIRPGYSLRKSLGIPPDLCDTNQGKIARRGYEFQPKLTGIGHCCIRKLRLHAKTLVEQPDAECL